MLSSHCFRLWGFCLFFGLWDLNSPIRNQTSHPVQWQYNVLSTGSSGDSPNEGVAPSKAWWERFIYLSKIVFVKSSTFIGRTDAEAEAKALILWPPDVKS